jgi:hypothetical protein
MWSSGTVAVAARSSCLGVAPAMVARKTWKCTQMTHKCVCFCKVRIHVATYFRARLHLAEVVEVQLLHCSNEIVGEEFAVALLWRVLVAFCSAESLGGSD